MIDKIYHRNLLQFGIITEYIDMFGPVITKHFSYNFIMIIG